MKTTILTILLLLAATILHAQQLKSFMNDNFQYGYKDEKGTVKIQPKYSSATEFSNGLAIVSLNEKFGYLDATGNVKINLQYENASAFSDGLAAVQLNGKWGYIDPTGKIVLKPIYEGANRFGEGLAAVCISRKEKETGWGMEEEWIFIDKTGKQVFTHTFTRMDDTRFSEGLCAVINEEIQDENDKNDTRKFDAYGRGLYAGYINKSGKTVVPFHYNRADDFSEGIAKVMVHIGEYELGYSFIDKTGKLLFPYIKCRDIEGNGKTFKTTGKVKVHTYDETGNNEISYYINVKGEKVP